MNVACPECRSVFRVDPTRVPPHGVRARCSVCGGIMPVEPAGGPAADSWSGFGRGTPRAAAAETAPSPALPASVEPVPMRVAATPPPAAPSVWPPLPAAPVQPAATPPAAPREPTPLAMPAIPAPGAAVAAGPRISGPSGARPPINPFLANDPNQKAKRLARALVSDIVAYHPQLHEQGVRDGTLRQVFKDEIKKSYEEYVEQVGKEFADSTTHFQDALNEILAAGRKLF